MFCGNIKINKMEPMYQFDEDANILTIKCNSGELINENNIKVLNGNIFPNDYDVIFYRNKGFDYSGKKDSYDVDMLINKKYSDLGVSKIKFRLKELDYMLSGLKRIYENPFNFSNITIQDFNNLNSKDYEIEIEKKKMKFIIEHSYDVMSNSLSPINFHLSLSVKYDFKDDYDLIYKTINCVKKLFSFLCYRNNICFECIEIFDKNKDNKFLSNGIIKYYEKIYNEKDIEKDINKSVIPFYLVRDKFDNIFQRIIDNKIGLRYLPNSYSSRKTYLPPRLIMICSTFEFEFRESFGNKIEHKNKTLSNRKNVKNILDEVIKVKKLNSDEKAIIKRLKKLVDSENYSTMVREIIKKSDLFECISKSYYKKSFKPYDITPLCNTLETMRNNMAHYKIEGSYEESRLFAISFLEIIIYSMQLKCCGIDEKNIIEIIKSIFPKKI